MSWPKMPGSPISRGGLRTVLFGDSMTDFYSVTSSSATLNSATYTGSTGILELVYATAPQFYDGQMARVWHYGYTSMRDHVYVPLVKVSATTWRVQLDANLAGVPDADIKGSSFFFYVDQARKINSFVSWIQMWHGWPLHIVRNAGQSGDMVAGNYRRFARDIAAYSPDIVIGQCPGINDLTTSNGPRTEADITGDLEDLFDSILSTGATMIVGTISPVSSAETDRDTQANMQTVLRVNDWIRRYARGRRRMYVVDHYRNFIDVADSSGLALAARVTSDGIHPATKTSILNAKMYSDIVKALIPNSDSTLPKAKIDCHANSRLTVSSASCTSEVVTVNSTAHGYRVGDEFRVKGASKTEAVGVFTVASATANAFTFSAPGCTDGAITGMLISRSRNIYANPLFQTTTGGTVGTTGNSLSGTLPDFLAVSNAVGTGMTAVASSAAAVNVTGCKLGDPVGNEAILTISDADASNRPGFVAEGSTTISQDILPGRSYVLECVLRLTSSDWASTPIKNALCTFSVTGSSVTHAVSALASQDTTETEVIAEDMRIHLRTPVLKVDSGQTVSNADFLVAITIQSTFASKSLVMALSQFAVWDVTGDEDSWH